jgi:hypothetical protein
MINEVNQAPLPQAFLFQQLMEALDPAFSLILGAGCTCVPKCWTKSLEMHSAQEKYRAFS